MFIAIDERTGKRISAYKALPNNSEYSCPYCEEKVILRNGEVRVPHFAHQSNSLCDRYYDSSNVMSDWHINWQEQFPEECREVIFKGKDENKHIADVFYNNYIIEFQHSPMSPEEFYERTKFYYRFCRRLIWLFDFSDECNIYEYEDNKWAWDRPKRTFIQFNSGYGYWKDKVCLMFQDAKGDIRRIVWNIHEYDKSSNSGANNYKKFCTKGCWNKDEFILSIKHFDF